ncbi:MAG: ABC transporter ATP-binding protein [Chitinophagaceae bacterium]
MMESSPLLDIKNLSVNFISENKATSALRNISFSVRKGEIVALVGESGSGKSVTALSVLRLVPTPPAQYVDGSITFSVHNGNNIDLLKTSSKEIQLLRGNKIGMIFQEPMTSLNPVLRCGDQVSESIRLHKKISFAKAKSEAIGWLKKVNLPDPEAIYRRYPHQLSGGQKQRIMIAMAMCCNPALLICDEPTTALDVTVQKNILDLIKELQQEQNMGVLFITHDLGVVAEIADRAIVMYRGEIVEQNQTKGLFQSPKHPYTKALLACRPIFHSKGEKLPVVNDFLTIGNSMSASVIKKGAKDKNNRLKKEESSILLSVHNLSVRFASTKNIFGKPLQFVSAVNNLSFKIYKGETLGLVGESGCGKTTLGRALLRLIEPTSGTVMFNNAEFLKLNKNDLIKLRREVQVIFQDPYSSLNPRLTIGEAIEEPLAVHHLNNNRQLRKEKVIELLERVDLRADHYKRYPHEFSGGQRQRIVIARALALNPSFLVCDESVSALDVSVQAQVLNLLNDLKEDLGLTVIFISHDLSVVRYISDRIMVMQKGNIVESGDAEEIYTNPVTDYTKKLIASIPKGIIH